MNDIMAQVIIFGIQAIIITILMVLYHKMEETEKKYDETQLLSHDTKKIEKQLKTYSYIIIALFIMLVISVMSLSKVI